MKIALIPARGGSKRIPRKNIKNFCGKPMISYAIDSAIKSGIFDLVWVSTDDQEIVELSIKYGAEIPFIRPKYLSDDHTSTLEVVKHTISFCDTNSVKCDFLCCIYPCNPFLMYEDLVEALKLSEENSGRFVYPVCEYKHPIQRAIKINSNGQTSMSNDTLSTTRTQDLMAFYHDAGQFYWGDHKSWSDNHTLHDHAIPLIIPNHRVVDIDNYQDWQRAEILYRSGLIKAV